MSEDRKTNFNQQNKQIMARYEGKNKRVKDWRFMNSIWCHGWKAHVRYCSADAFISNY